MDLIQILKALNDENRLRILNIIKDKPLCVCEIELLLRMSQSNVSRHLSKLTSARLVNYYKEAKYVYYELNLETLEIHPFLKSLIFDEINKLDSAKIDSLNLISLNNGTFNCEEIDAQILKIIKYGENK